MIILLGESASGKSSIAKALERKYGYKRIIQYTTRPKRDNEIDKVDYYFITESEFENVLMENQFIEYSKYNDWYYGTKCLHLNDNPIIVCTPSSFRKIKDCLHYYPEMIKSFYISIPRQERLIKNLQRGDNIDEAYRRNLSEVGQFDGIEHEVSEVIYNPGYEKSIDDIADYIYKYTNNMSN